MAAPGVENLLAAVKQLPPDELAQFTAGFILWQESDGPVRPENVLLQQARQSLPLADRNRLQELAGKSEQEDLTAAELMEYRDLSERAERIDAARVRALAELADRRNEPIRQVMDEIGWLEPSHGG